MGTRKLARRVLVTLLVPLAAWAAGHVTLPGVDGDVMRQIIRWAGRPSGGLEQISVVALGLMPAISGFTLVELAALMVPRWRPLRTGGPAGRASLRASAIAVSLGLAAIQGWFFAVWLEGTSWQYRYGELIDRPGLATRLVIMVTLVGGTCLMIALAWLIDRHGLGGGFPVLLASGAVVLALELVEACWRGVGSGMLDFVDVLSVLLRIGAVALGTWWILTVHRRVPGALRHPTSGAIPIATAASLLMLPLTLANLGLRLGPLELQPGSRAYELADALLIGLLCAGLSWLFYREARGTPRWWQGIGRTAAFSIAVVLVMRPSRAPLTVEVTVVMVAVAVAMDLAGEWRARQKLGELVAVWPVHQVARLDELVEKLAAAGVPVHARGAYYRALLQFFGPFAPIELLVPVERAAEARALLEPASVSKG